jgi:hypothetical protein
MPIADHTTFARADPEFRRALAESSSPRLLTRASPRTAISARLWTSETFDALSDILITSTAMDTPSKLPDHGNLATSAVRSGKPARKARRTSWRL